MTELSSFHQASSLPFHEMKLDDPITTECCHAINTKGWNCTVFRSAVIYHLVTEVRASEQARDKCREEGVNHKRVTQEIEGNRINSSQIYHVYYIIYLLRIWTRFNQIKWWRVNIVFRG